MPAPDFARARIGNVLSGKWKLDELLGWGGMATVYAGTHTRNRSRVAVKVLHPEVGRDPVLRTRFLREGYVANSIKHRGIVRVFDDSAEDESAYLVMELLSGKTLKEAWKKSDRALPLREIGRVISSILDCLAAAHAAGIVHRDIKPDNVFLTDEGDVKVLDFGIAFVQELRAAGEHVTTTGTTLGTPAFMPPEQALGKWSLVDHRADIFSVGATARLLLTGRLPHDASGATELLIAAATRRVEPILTVMPNLPAPIAAVLDRALGFEREERYQSAEEMKGEWDRALAAAIASGTESVPPSAAASAALPVSWGSGAVGDAPSEPSQKSGNADAASGAAAAPASGVEMVSAAAPADALPTSTDPGASFTQGAVEKDARSRGRGVVPFLVVGIVAAIVVGVGIFAFGKSDRKTASSAAETTSLAGPPAAEAPTSATATATPTNLTGSSSVLTSASAPAAPSSTASAPLLKTMPAPSAHANPNAQSNCPPVFYGRDMNDEPEYRCCGKPCSH